MPVWGFQADGRIHPISKGRVRSCTSWSLVLDESLGSKLIRFDDHVLQGVLKESSHAFPYRPRNGRYKIAKSSPCFETNYEWTRPFAQKFRPENNPLRFKMQDFFGTYLHSMAGFVCIIGDKWPIEREIAKKRFLLLEMTSKSITWLWTFRGESSREKKKGSSQHHRYLVDL